MKPPVAPAPVPVLKSFATGANFSYKNFIKSNWRTLLIIIICSIFYSFGVMMFLSKAATIPAGLSAISISLSYIFTELKPYLSLLYLALNIPIILVFWTKLKRKFLLLTILFLITNAVFGFIFSLKPIDDFFSTQVFVFIDKAFDPVLGPNGAIISNQIVYRGWPVFIYVVLALSFCSPASAIIWKKGASTGGTDIIAHYFSTKKKKDVGLFLMISGYATTLVALVTIWLFKNFAPSAIANQINGFNKFFGVQAVGSVVYIYINSLVINILYPKYKKVLMKIDSKSHKTIIEWLEKSEYWHPYKIVESESGYTKQKNYSIESIVLLLESEDIARKIKLVEPNAWISVQPISKIYGRFNYSSVE